MTPPPEILQKLFRLAENGYFENVVEEHLAAISQYPEHLPLYHALALYCAKSQQLDMASVILESALQLKPDHAGSWFHMGRILYEKMDFQGSVGCYLKSIELEPSAKSIFHLSLSQLSAGYLADGAQNYAHRFCDGELQEFHHLALWEPSEASRKVLIWAEQGLGDEIMFSRFFVFLRDLPGEFTVECDRRLLGLYAENFPWLRFLPRGQPRQLSCFDAHLPLGGLFTLWSDRINTPPLMEPVLHPVPAVRPEWGWLRQPGKQYVGISWLSMNEDFGARRSVAMQELLSAFDPARHALVNLQYLPPPQDLERARQAGFELVSTADCFADVEGMAWVISRCDAVVSIDNTALHLAGAMGAPTYALVPHLPNWRWQVCERSCGWYPHVELLFQTQQDSWDAELAQLRQRLS
ncbi:MULTISPECIES: hypothetical protein [Comamonas]|uniref:hypothetical protein n=1 Tax=Comamonas TaxID=283 RepID=UPI0012C68588|nr:MULTISPECIES: hypothetical protein [Comamonas]MEB5966754.1 hypothetical protein [Comamonas testosteroni]MPS93893.1 hypothetical protein [Comamonas sp.]